MKKYFPIVLVILTACLFRFLYLDRIPTAISGDELLYSITAKSVSLTGRDISGTWNPLSALIFRYPPGEQQAELSYFLHLMVSASPFSLLVAKLPFALLSVGIVALLFLIAHELFGRSAAIATGLIAAINPWLIVMGRTGYEATPSTFFYLTGFYLLLKLRSWKILWSLIPFVLAFYSYIATKLVFLPFICLAAIVAFYRRKPKSRTPYVVLIALSIMVVATFVLLLKTNHAGARLSEILLPNSPIVASQVDLIRKNSLSSPFVPFIVNKHVAYIQIVFSKLFQVFSPQYVFVQGDQFFLPVNQGFFYYLDSIFIVLGTLFLFVKKRLYAVLICLFVILGSLPHVFHKTMTDFSIHLTLMYPFLIILIGVGITEGLTSISKRFRIFATATVLLLYIFNIVGFAGAYYYAYPMAGSGDFPMRVLSTYIRLAKQSGKKITLYSSRKGDFLKKYLFYTNGMNANTMPDISRIDTHLPFDFDGVHFTDCDAGVQTVPDGGLGIYDATCDMKLTGLSTHISRLTDGGALYTIINDPLCKRETLNAYPTGVTISDLAIEKLPPSRFCTIYVSQ